MRPKAATTTKIVLARPLSGALQARRFGVLIHIPEPTHSVISEAAALLSDGFDTIVLAAFSF